MNELQRVWVIGGDLKQDLLYQVRVSELEIKVVSSVEELDKQVGDQERLIVVADEENFVKLDDRYSTRLLAKRLIFESFNLEETELTIRGVISDAIVQHDLEIAEANAWSSSHIAYSSQEEFTELVGSAILDISRCRNAKEIESALNMAFAHVESFKSVKIAVDPPHLSSKFLAIYQVATPIFFSDELVAHVYVEFSEQAVMQEKEYILDFLANLQDAVALSVERNRMIKDAEFNRAIWEVSFNAVGDPLIILDSNYLIKDANKSYLELVDKRLEDIVGKPCPTPSKEQLTKAEKSSSTESWEYAVHKRTFRVSVSRFKTETENVVVFMRDITREKQLTQSLLNQAKGQELGVLISSVAHELNNPIGGISALTQLLLMEVDKKSDAYHALDGILKSADSCKSIIQTMLSLVRTDSEAVARVNVHEVFLSASNLLETELNRLGVQVSLSESRAGLEIKANRNRLLQIIFHLLQHSLQAIEACTDKKLYVINLNLEHYLSEGYFIVEDNGVDLHKMYDIESIVSFTVVKLLLEEINATLTVERVEGINRQIVRLQRAVPV